MSIEKRAEEYAFMKSEDYGCYDCEITSDEYKLKQAYIQGAKDERRWVSVSERLPEAGKRVFVELPNNHITTALLLIDGNKKYWRTWSGTEFEIDEVIHWQEIPDAPEEVTKGSVSEFTAEDE